jgi:hypothetical protein
LGKINDNSVTPDNKPVAGVGGAVTDMLTVWRRLWIERDAMTGVAPNTVGIFITGVTPNVAQPGTGGANDVVQLNVTLPDNDDAFEGGTLTAL